MKRRKNDERIEERKNGRTKYRKEVTDERWRSEARLETLYKIMFK